MLSAVLFASLLSLVVGQGCLFDVTIITSEPLVLTTTYQFIYPTNPYATNQHNILIGAGETVLISCPGGHVMTGKNSTPSSSIFVTCNHQEQLIYEDFVLKNRDIHCNKARIESVKHTGLSCGPTSKKVLIGYEIGHSINFVPLITVCFDFVKQTPYWSNYYLSSSIGHREKPDMIDSVYFEDPSFYNLTTNFKTLYNIDYQRTTLNGILDLPKNSHKFIDETPFKMIPLANPADFIYHTQIGATAHYFNTVPQWFFEGKDNNWDLTTSSLNLYARLHNVDLDIFSGTYGIASIKNSPLHSEAKIWLGTSPNNQTVVPVPQILWKLAHEPLSRRATVFLTVNNPFETDLTSKAVICDDISDSIIWLKWIKKNDPQNGYSYACTYHEFRKLLPALPALDVKGTLL